MGESTCLVRGFSYASAIPNESKQGNPMHALGESISFGRYMNDQSLSWERWSTFPHKKYVEEAERYAQPGSVAQKKAFFEAHYKKIAAQKAAALLEQENAAKREAGVKDGDLYPDHQQRALVNGSSLHVSDGKENATVHHDSKENVVIRNENINIVDAEESGKDEGNAVITENEAIAKRTSIDKFDNIENQGRVSVSDGSGTPQIERPLLKSSVASEDAPPSVTSKKKSSLSTLKSTIQRKTWRIPATPAKQITTPMAPKENNLIAESARKSNADSTDKKTFSPKSLRALMSLISNKESEKEPNSASKKTKTAGISRGSTRPPKDCATPLRTPSVAAAKGVTKNPAVTPQSENKRMRTPKDPSRPGSKTTGPKWHILSAVSKSLSDYGKKLQSPSASTPFILRTEERAAKRKQKLEEKFNANEAQKVQTPQRTLKEKAGNEFRKLSHSFCFKARPLPNFYKERETPKARPLPNFYKERETPKAPVEKIQAVVRPQPAMLTRNHSKKQQQGGGTISMPPPPPPPTSLSKNRSRPSNNLASRKNFENISKSHAIPFPERITHENTSPNIQ